MIGFDSIHFHGTFRSYQQRVLDNADKYLKDGKIHIVAAPGSGKTILGLELICRLASPCIILSPTTAVRQQWGNRFRDFFLDDENNFDLLFSNDLHVVRLINSITYQALYTAVEKIISEDNDDIDCSDVDLFEEMRKYGIKTVCLDEAHHLKNEWQKALEKFISALDRDVKVISLTATPPYDSEGAEWHRYTDICGEIDEEIFVPELVGQNTLCPHQDYIYFNYPTETEAALFREYKKHAAAAIDEIGKLDFLNEVCKKMNYEKNYEFLFNSVKEYISLMVLFRYYGFEVGKKLERELTAKKGLPDFEMEYAEMAVQFLLDGKLLPDERKSEIINILKKNTVYDKRKAVLVLNEKIKRSLISSVGKLTSIRQIAKNEFVSMGDRLRMLILTDYIKKENLIKIGTEEEFDSIHVVSIFETIRRTNLEVKLGILSGSLVVLPETIDLSFVDARKESIPGTNYCTVEFSGETHRSVGFVGELFEKGELQILIGTKSLLGEGWDSPCINSLILASFVGSFVLSNQMRGRAIRIDRNDPNKSANIWHLVTVEPEYLFEDNALSRMKKYMKQDDKELISCDFEILKRRFESFMGPNYTTGVIESGIERITAVSPPYDKAGIDRINHKMLELSSNRENIADQWRGEVTEGGFAVSIETKIPSEKRVPVFTFFNFALSIILFTTEITVLRLFWDFLKRRNVPVNLTLIFIFVALSFILYRLVKKIVLHSNPVHSIKTMGIAVYQTLCECDLISRAAEVKTNLHKELYFVETYLKNASVHDQNIFNTAMTELLSPIENPRYLLIAENRFGYYNYKLSFACPSVIGKRKECVEIFAEKLKSTTGNFKAVYTYREGGREQILKCRKQSYITYNQKAIDKKFKVSHWE